MKVVLFCGGLGTRLREHTGEIPKPMVKIGYRPILWHIMKYYATFGHRDFVLCLGYKADVIKEFFLHYQEWVSNDFTLLQGGKHLVLENNDIEDWSITFVDTGLSANIGQRLVAVRDHLDGDEFFLANYADGLTDLDLNMMIDDFVQTDKVASFLAVPPPQSFHVVDLNASGQVHSIKGVRDTNILINAGFFILRSSVFEYIESGEELVVEPFERLIEEDRLKAYRYDRYWCMDTFKEQQELTDMFNAGNAPWEVWQADSEPRPLA